MASTTHFFQYLITVGQARQDTRPAKERERESCKKIHGICRRTKRERTREESCGLILEFL